ncbi:Shikimate 5-dehydrogenase I alpha [Methylophaga thiooxydans]|uniref:Shikimate dehydrogenase (NADP(+)) n=1 Tax=Methylophaga thiooxydans TaxID=392484 RepID=A0A0A0BFR3_9GAMM|nr:shikimate dehydrogenase [Methylophaga thiooxydans]KGM07373.1 Shikimate 5-dehydrogenase I alpha [Methylophaga thiooxydans]
MTDNYAVIGNPISHSKSPLIHSEFARQTEQDMAYTAIEVPLDGFTDSLKQLRDVLKLRGINITVPFKEQAWQQIENKSERAMRAGAINTILFNQDGSMYGENTDGIGLCQDLTVNHAVSLKDKRILLLGAGGAARGVVEPILAHQPKALFIANRTASKAEQLATIFAELGTVRGGGFDDITAQFDVVINATAASLQGDVPPLPDNLLADNACCYDMMYSDNDTAFITWAKNHGAAKTIDGLGMLVEQAAEAFRLWRGIKPATNHVIAMFRNNDSDVN